MGEFHKNGANAMGLPTKLDIRNEKNRGWLATHGKIRIFLDGEEQFQVMAFDTEKGTMTRHKIGDDGRVVIDPATGRVKAETVKGEVTVQWA